MLTNGSLQGVTILKDKILEDNTGVACHPDINKGGMSSGHTAFIVYRKMWTIRRQPLFWRIVINLCLGVYFAYSEDEELGVVDSV